MLLVMRSRKPVPKSHRASRRLAALQTTNLISRQCLFHIDPHPEPRPLVWVDLPSADVFREAGVTLFQTELTSDDGYDLTSLKQVLRWRDNG